MWRNNGLSIVLFLFFLLTLVGQTCSGWKVHNEEEREHGGTEISYTDFLRTSEFGETVFENWESEFLQMGFYVILTVFLIQKGSAESKKGDGSDPVDADPEKHRKDENAPGPVKAGGWRLALYKNSLSLAFLALFIVSFIGHLVAGARKYSGEQAQHGGREITALEYLFNARFWYESMQNWQSEFLAVFAIVVLSVWLRQWGSPESKPVHEAHLETGND
jgi:hypothetical protein